MDWIDWLEQSFAIEDLEFGLHPLDECRATTMVREARGTGWTDDEILERVDKWLREKGATADHRSKQRDKVQDFLDELV